MNAETIVEKQLQCYNAHDLEGFCALYDDNIEIYNLTDNTIMLTGKKELHAKYHNRFNSQKVQAKLVNRIVIGNKVIDHEHVVGIKQDEVVKAVAIYEVKNNLIIKVWFVFE